MDGKGGSGFLKILQLFPKQTLMETLYSEPSVCFVTFRELPEVARNIISRMLWMKDGAIISTIINGCIYTKPYSDILKLLTELAVVEQLNTDSGVSFSLTTPFSIGLKVAISGGGCAWLSYPPPGDTTKTAKSVRYLENYALERWECILYTFFELRDGNVSGGSITKDARNLLVRAELLRDDPGEDRHITTRGFQFLLLDKRSQAWTLASAIVGKENPSTAAVILLCNLALSRPSTVEYSTVNFSPEQLSILAYLREFGFVYQRSSKLPRFYTTSLSSALSSQTSSDSFTQQMQSQGRIAIETNFQLYVYTESRLEAALVSLFARPVCRFQNMIVAALTRESFRKALNDGITAQQVIDFLKSRAKQDSDIDPSLQCKISAFNRQAVPPAVSDQLHIWELERQRLSSQKACLYSEFDTPDDFAELRDYARKIDVLLWSPEETTDTRKMVMAIKPEGHDPLRRYWKKRRKNEASN